MPGAEPVWCPSTLCPSGLGTHVLGWKENTPHPRLQRRQEEGQEADRKEDGEGRRERETRHGRGVGADSSRQGKDWSLGPRKDPPRVPL